MPDAHLRDRLGGLRIQSLRSRLTIGVVAVLAVVLLLGGTYVVRDSERTERQSLDDRLQRTAELLDQQAEAVVNEEAPPNDPRLNRLLAATRSSLLVTLGDAEIYRAGLEVPGPLNGPLGFTTRTVRGDHVRVFTKVLSDKTLGGLARLQATSNLRPLEQRQAALQRRLITVGVGMLLVAAFAAAIAAEFVLRPLRRLRTHTRAIEDESDLDTRVPVAGPKEIRSLAGSFNAMLQRLGRSADERNQALDATRRFAADVGHELRTPLTSVQAALSTLHRHPDVPVETRSMMVADALAENRRLVLLLDGLQALARGDANRVAQEDVDLASVVADAVTAIQQVHPGTTFEAHLPDDPLIVRGWEPGLRALVDNLLRNAARHGRAGGRVEIGLRPGSVVEGPVLVVEDDGPGIAPEERVRVFEPFARAAGTEAPGSGLGLAIVAQQVRHHEAAVTIEDAVAGGARFVVRFPREA
ncbi:HAMP domain-containing sensor histidine kinase [Patulibacter sp. NPDC049589]|uniref:HAMP domain-containing sensor histidine kinase n=1 Tax=Patulibacter sp. NPDC049589 TaxID=3154731 RepID=UPI0034266851